MAEHTFDRDLGIPPIVWAHHPGHAARHRADLGLEEDAQFQRLRWQATGFEPFQRVHREGRRPAAADRRGDVIRAHLGDRRERAGPAGIGLQRAG